VRFLRKRQPPPPVEPEKSPEGDGVDAPPEARFECAAVCGVGLLGGSLGMALRQRGLASRVVGVGRDEGRLALAQERGAVDAWTLDIAEGCAGADLIVLCGPITTILDQLPQVFRVAPPGAVVTDVGSTKESIVRRAAQLARDDVHFIGSHPMAGSEKSGVAYADESLFEGATVVLTPDLTTHDDALHAGRDLWESLGGRVVEMLSARHDRVVAMLSHLPHVAASALVEQSRRGGEPDAEMLRAVAGAGFRDTTRIALGEAAMWTDILTDNADAVVDSLDNLIDVLTEIRRDIHQGDDDSIRSFLEAAAAHRARFEPPAGVPPDTQTDGAAS
jgi:prephenate dehydrogenase